MKKIKQIKKTAQEFFDKTSFEVAIDVGEQEDVFLVEAKMNDPQVLIGEGGRTLVCLQTILSKIIKKKLGESVYLDLDINDYKKKKMNYLKEMARNYADEVALSRQEKELASMPAYERRIIHMELKQRSDVNTESRGQDPERKVVIRPA